MLGNVPRLLRSPPQKKVFATISLIPTVHYEGAKRPRKTKRMSEIKKRIYRDKIASELFSKSNFILNNPYLEFDQIRKEDFFEYIFGSAYNDDPLAKVLPFDDENGSGSN